MALWLVGEREEAEEAFAIAVSMDPAQLIAIQNFKKKAFSLPDSRGPSSQLGETTSDRRR